MLRAGSRATKMKLAISGMMETPIYAVAEAAQYLGVPQNTLACWLKGGDPVPPLIKVASAEPPRLSFSNLLECYMLSSMRAIYDVRIPTVRKALITLAKYVQHKHPLIEQASLPNMASSRGRSKKKSAGSGGRPLSLREDGRYLRS